MPVINRHAIVPYQPAQMYALVDDIQAYPEFLPWCKAAREWSRDKDQVKATIELAKGGLQKSFTTLNRLQHNKMIEMRLVEGPFRHLEGFWRFEALGDGQGDAQACKVKLDLEYEFSNALLSLTVGPVFNQVANTLVEAFCQRAAMIYGKP